MNNLISKEEKDRIDSVCEKYRIKKYSINSNGSIDVDGDVDLSIMKLTELPIKFNNVSGDFGCNDNYLSNLEGCPKIVGGDLFVFNNRLTSLIGAPDEVMGDFNCRGNLLVDLYGSPLQIGEDFICADNMLTTLDGSPHTIGGDFNARANLLISLDGSPVNVGGDYSCSYNKITNLMGIAEKIGGGLNCFGNNKLSSTYSGNTDIDLGDGGVMWGSTNIPYPIRTTYNKHIRLILKYQRPFEIWDGDQELNMGNLLMLIEEIEDGLM